jgi:hypothetical protein
MKKWPQSRSKQLLKSEELPPGRGLCISKTIKDGNSASRILEKSHKDNDILITGAAISAPNGGVKWLSSCFCRLIVMIVGTRAISLRTPCGS